MSGAFGRFVDVVFVVVHGPRQIGVWRQAGMDRRLSGSLLVSVSLQAGRRPRPRVRRPGSSAARGLRASCASIRWTPRFRVEGFGRLGR
jgi:hypothetical protein